MQKLPGEIEEPEANATMTENKETRVLGIDPGLNITGYGVISVQATKISVVEAGIVRSKRSDDLGKRLGSIHDGIRDVIKSLAPDCIGLEELYSHYERPKTV
jgi:crossover junction endodeoxyribonuclease RuvC